MQTYRIDTPVHGSISLAGYGNVEFDYKTGAVTPGDEREAQVLSHLETLGIAKIAEPMKSGKAPKYAAEDAAPAPVEEI